MANATMTGGPAGGASEIKRELGDDAQRLTHTAAQQAESKAREGQQQATQTARAASSAIQKAADELSQDDQAPAWLASAASSAARQVGQFAEQIESTSPREAARWITDFARNSPGSFLTASAAIGFAAARVLRAGADYQHEADAGNSSGGTNQTPSAYQPPIPASASTLSSTGAPSPTDNQLPPIRGYGDGL